MQQTTVWFDFKYCKRWNQCVCVMNKNDIFTSERICYFQSMLFSLLVSDYMHFDCLRCSQIDADATSAFIPAQIKIFTRASLLKILMFSLHSMKIFTIFIAKELISPVYLVFSKKVRLDSSRESIYMKWLAKSYFLKKIIKKRINKYNVEGYNFAQRLKG